MVGWIKPSKTLLAIVVVFQFLILTASSIDTPWKYVCNGHFCEKTRITDAADQDILSLSECRLVCSEFSALWPQPTGDVSISKDLVVVNPTNMVLPTYRSNTPASTLLAAMTGRFKEQVGVTGGKAKSLKRDGVQLIVQVSVTDETQTSLTLGIDESYLLTANMSKSGGTIQANVTAKTPFGVRHGLETLGQLIVYDDIRGLLKMPSQISVSDAPAYPHRGIVLDTSRNYLSIDSLKRTVEGMAASKLNTLHLHITDTHSFPFQAPSLPDVGKLGAYSPDKVFTAEDIEGLSEYATQRGVRLVPELDQPAHVGEGWQDTGFLVCFKAEPWQDYCVEPPCGQFDPTNEALYDSLEALYRDFLKYFSSDVFHMGGDEVHFGCWNSSEKITSWMAAHNIKRDEDGFVQLWEMYQNKSLDRLYKAAGKEIPVILWTSTLTQKQYLHVLPKEKYIIQVWTTGNDPQVSNLLENGYTLILSNYDALYFDCGFAGWVTDGNNWCSPYIGWQKVYENTPAKIAGERKSQVLGAEAALWTEQADESSLDGRIWPRAAAMAEALWAEPETSWRQAEQRFLVHRERLVARKIAADALEPQWCSQNENKCPSQPLPSSP